MTLGKSNLKLKVDAEPSGESQQSMWANAMNIFSNLAKQGKAKDAQAAKVTKLQGQQYGTQMEQTMQGVNSNLHLNAPNAAPAAFGYTNPDPNFNSMSSYVPVAPPQSLNANMTVRNPYAENPNQNPYYFTSDETQKEQIATSAKDIQQFLDAMGQPKSYKYKNTSLNGTSEGTHISPMAQELEKSKLAKEYVEEGEDGVKRVAYGHPRMVGLALSALAHLNQKIKKLEK